MHDQLSGNGVIIVDRSPSHILEQLVFSLL